MSNQSQAEDENAHHEEEAEPEHVKIIQSEQIDQIWNTEDPLEFVYEIYTSYFNPSHSHEYDLVDDNTIKFLSEFQIYNLIFCKNDLKLNDDQCAEVLDILWCLLAVNQDGTMQDHSVPAEGNLQEALTCKFEELKTDLIDRAKQGIFNKDEIKQIMSYMKSGYFKHFRLIDFVLRNKQLPTMKHITLFHDEPLAESALDNAKEIVDEPMIPKAEGEAEQDDEIDLNRDPLEDIDNRLASVELDEDSKNEVKSKLQEYNNEINQKIEEQKNKRK